MQRYYVYILQSNKNRHYIGFTSNLEQRLSQHNRKHNGFTNSNEETWEVLCYLECNQKKEAMEFERKLKAFKNSMKAKNYMLKCSGVEHPDF